MYFFDHDIETIRSSMYPLFNVYLSIIGLFATVVHLCFEKRVRFAFRTVLIRVFIGSFSQDRYFYEVTDTRRYRTLS